MVLLSEYPQDPRPRREAETLAAEGMEIDVICIKGHPSDLTRERVHSVNVFRFPIYHKRGGKLTYIFQYGAFLAAAFFLMAWRTLRRRYHLIHVHNMPDILVFSAAVPKLFGAKVILDLHDPMPELMRTIFSMDEHSRGVWALKFLEKCSLRFADAVVTVSETFRRIFCSRNCPGEKVRVVMNSPDEKIFPFREPVKAELPREDRPYVIMFHGSLVERHGLALALEALEKVRLKFPQVILRVYGKRTAHLEEVLRRAEQRGMAGFVDYRGPESLDGIVAAIDDCDLGLVPNLRNAFTEINTPTRIFEFLVRGKPVIAPDGRGVSEFFAPGEVLMFSLGDADDLAAGIEFAIQHPEAMFETVKKGQRVCRTRRWSEERHRLVELVQGLVSGSTARGPSPAASAAAVAT